MKELLLNPESIAINQDAGGKERHGLSLCFHCRSAED